MSGKEGKLPASSPTNVLTVEDSINSSAKSLFHGVYSLILEGFAYRTGGKNKKQQKTLHA